MGKIKLSEADLLKLRYLHDQGGSSVRELARAYGISKSQVHRILNNKQRTTQVRGSD